MQLHLQRLRGERIFESDHLSYDLGGKSVRGGGVLLASQGIMVGTNLIRSVVLARLLTPDDYGLIGMVTVLVGFSVMFRDAGLSMATVQRAHITEAQISSLFWCNIVLSLGLGLLICISSPLVSLFYGKSELTMITIALAIPFVFNGLQVQHQALLRRHMLFGQIAIIDIISNVIAIVAAVILALKGARYWALVGSSWAQAISALYLTLFFCAWRPKRFQRGVGLRSMLAFGGHLTGFSFFNYFSRNLDSILIGRFLGTGALGVYQRAYTLMMQPLQQLNGPLSSVGAPALSRLQEDPERYKKYFMQAGGLLLLITMPAAAFFIVMSREIILVLFGDRWELAVKPFMYLSLSVIVQPLGNITGWLFVSQGRAKDQMTWGLIGSTLTVASIALGLLWGVDGVAACYSLGGLFVVTPVLYWFVGRRGFVTTADLYCVIGRKIIYFAVFFLLLLLGRLALRSLGATNWSILLIMGISFSVCLGATLFFAKDAEPLKRRFFDGIKTWRQRIAV